MDRYGYYGNRYGYLGFETPIIYNINAMIDN